MNKETMLGEGELVADNESKGEFIYYVARGIVVEKNGKLADTSIPNL